jgi:hypothetical protein
MDGSAEWAGWRKESMGVVFYAGASTAYLWNINSKSFFSLNV